SDNAANRNGNARWPRLEEQIAMSRAKKALVVAVVAALGLWGCAKGPGNGAATAERTKMLEQKINKLEEDFRAAATAPHQVPQKPAAAEDQRARLEKEVAQLALVVKERDDLRRQITVRTSERDAVQVQYDQFRKAIREVLGQAETAAGTSVPQPVSSAAGVVPGNS